MQNEQQIIPRREPIDYKEVAVMPPRKPGESPKAVVKEIPEQETDTEQPEE